MQSYTVHVPANAKADRIERAEQMLFVYDGFSWLTALFPLIGLIANRLWLFALIYVTAVTGAVIALDKAGTDPAWLTLGGLALNFLLGFEISSLRRWWLEQAGWEMVGTVSGKTLAECERRFFESWLPDQPVLTMASSMKSGAPPPLPFSGRRWPFARPA